VAKFGAYEILHELKSGGMGAVLLGRRRGPGAFEQLVAIKTIRAEYANAEAVRAMFLDEAAILARINHPGIATVHDFGEEAGTLYMVMEYVAGISFRSLADLAMPPGVAARAIAEACRGVHAAHEVRDNAGQLMGLVHRDISPDNLMLGFDGHVKVIDFGIALIKNRQSPVTEFGTVKGKPPYMSPEQVKNESMDRRSDVFSLAVVFHELLTSEPLFDGDSIYAIARAVEHSDIKPPSVSRGSELPIGLDAAVMNALDRDLARRTPTAAALAEQLEQVISAAGDETLEAWADRELAAPRDAHRAWLASVIAGHDMPHPTMGRATGSVTPLGPLAHITSLPTPVPAALPTGEPPPDPGASTHLAAATGDEVLVRRSLALPILLGLIVLLGIGGAIVYLTRSPPTTIVRDARAIDAPIAVDAPAIADAEVDAVIVDAAVDAGRTGPRDARVVAKDATIVATKPDAAIVEPPSGIGSLIVKPYDNTSYLEVHVDGKLFGKTPIMKPKPIDAGRHTVTLVSPTTGDIVYKTTIVVKDGETSEIRQPGP
jgi:predicted Ser/Thr protein kinase